MAEFRDLQGNVSSGGIGADALALQFLILTATRTDEVLWARWSEITLEKREWLGPADRMKSQHPHKVPLSGAAIAILEGMPRVDGNPYIFPGRERPSVDARRLYKLACRAEGSGGKQPRRPNKQPAMLTPNSFARLLRAMGAIRRPVISDQDSETGVVMRPNIHARSQRPRWRMRSATRQSGPIDVAMPLRVGAN
jgi:hypothetical protein